MTGVLKFLLVISVLIPAVLAPGIMFYKFVDSLSGD